MKDDSIRFVRYDLEKSVYFFVILFYPTFTTSDIQNFVFKVIEIIYPLCFI